MAGQPASSDFLIDRDGHQWQITASTRYAYHAGDSYWYHEGVNLGDEVSEALLGVELECHPDLVVTYEQYDSLAELMVEQGLRWGWRWPYIVLGHYAVARPRGRRSDPTDFDWGTLMGRLFVHSQAAGVGGLVNP